MLLENLQVLKDHYTPGKSVIVKCFRFNQQKHHDDDSVRMYIAELWKLSINCEFGDALNDMLLDRLGCGLSSPKIQKSTTWSQEASNCLNLWHRSLSGASRS